MRTRSLDYVHIGSLYNGIGDIYRFQNDNNQALESFNKAIKLFKQANDENHSYMAAFYNNIAVVYRC
jgi:tetratricopeptide (TPR) repeat protein